MGSIANSQPWNTKRQLDTSDDSNGPGNGVEWLRGITQDIGGMPGKRADWEHAKVEATNSNSEKKLINMEHLQAFPANGTVDPIFLSHEIWMIFESSSPLSMASCLNSKIRRKPQCHWSFGRAITPSLPGANAVMMLFVEEFQPNLELISTRYPS